MTSSVDVTDTELPKQRATLSETNLPLGPSYFPDKRMFTVANRAFSSARRRFHLPEFAMRKSLLLKKVLLSTAVAGGSLAGLFASPETALARVKLITLPVRERVEIQLDNATATLVEEERVVPLVKGENQVDFSWANTQIDPNTIVFRVIAPVGEKMIDVKVLSVSYPPNEAALIWALGSSDSGSVRVRVSYLLGNLNKSFNYRAVASKDETILTLSQYIRLQNFANESFGSTGVWAGFGKRFLKPVGLNETKEMLME